MFKKSRKVLSIALIPALLVGFVSLFSLNGSSKKKIRKFEEFESKVSAMSETYDSGDYMAPVTVLKSSDDLEIKNDGTIMVAEEVVAAKATGGKSKVSIDEIEQEYNVEVKENEDSVIISKPYQTKRLIVKASGKIDDMGAVAVADGYDDLHVMQYETEEAAKEAYENYQSTKKVKYVEFDSVVSINESDYTEVTGAQASYVSWAPESIGIDDYNEKLNENIGESNLPAVIVAVIDSGIDTDHEVFGGYYDAQSNPAGRIASNGFNFSGTGQEGNPEDDNGHGTSVSGIVVDETLSNVKILPIKVLDRTGSGLSSGVLAGIEAAILNGAHVINMSLSGEGTSALISGKIAEARNAGIPCVVSAGNESSNASNYWPANTEEAITIGAIAKIQMMKTYNTTSYWQQTYNSNFKDIKISFSTYPGTYILTWFSNYGEKVDFVTPGAFIKTAKKDGGYKDSFNGTSASAPVAAAAVASIISYYKCSNEISYSVGDIEKILADNCVDLGEANKDILYANGLIDLSNISFDFIEGKENGSQGGDIGEGPTTYNETQQTVTTTEVTTEEPITENVTEPSTIEQTTNGDNNNKDNGNNNTGFMAKLLNFFAAIKKLFSWMF